MVNKARTPEKRAADNAAEVNASKMPPVDHPSVIRAKNMAEKHERVRAAGGVQARSVLSFLRQEKGGLNEAANVLSSAEKKAEVIKAATAEINKQTAAAVKAAEDSMEARQDIRDASDSAKAALEYNTNLVDDGEYVEEEVESEVEVEEEVVTASESTKPNAEAEVVSTESTQQTEDVSGKPTDDSTVASGENSQPKLKNAFENLAAEPKKKASNWNPLNWRKNWKNRKK